MSMYKQKGNEEFGFLFFILAILLALSFITDFWTSDEEHAEESMNSIESAMMQNYVKQKTTADDEYTYPEKDYVATYLALFNIRYDQGDGYSNVLPFCDIYDRVLLDELNIMNTETKLDPKHLVTKQFYAVTGRLLVDACTGKKIGVTSPKTPVPVLAPEPKEPEQSSEILSGEEYDEVMGSVTECKRAAKTVMKLTSGGKYLTKDDSKEITIALRECDRYKLEKLINEG